MKGRVLSNPMKQLVQIQPGNVTLFNQQLTHDVLAKGDSCVSGGWRWAIPHRWQQLAVQ